MHRARNKNINILNLRRERMSTIKIRDGTQIHYEDWGNGQPVVFSHGCPLSADAWDVR